MTFVMSFRVALPASSFAFKTASAAALFCTLSIKFSSKSNLALSRPRSASATAIALIPFAAITLAASSRVSSFVKSFVFLVICFWIFSFSFSTSVVLRPFSLALSKAAARALNSISASEDFPCILILSKISVKPFVISSI